MIFAVQRTADRGVDLKVRLQRHCIGADRLALSAATEAMRQLDQGEGSCGAGRAAGARRGMGTVTLTPPLHMPDKRPREDWLVLDDGVIVGRIYALC